MFSRECIGILILSAILRSPDLFPNYHIRIGRAVYFAMGSTDEWARGSGGRRGRENCEISEIRHLDHVHEAGRMAATNRPQLKLMTLDLAVFLPLFLLLSISMGLPSIFLITQSCCWLSYSAIQINTRSAVDNEMRMRNRGQNKSK